jgi:hypothetical protein
MPVSVPLSGVVTDGSGTISFGPDTFPGPVYAVTDSCPANIALFLDCGAETITGETFNLTIKSRFSGRTEQIDEQINSI